MEPTSTTDTVLMLRPDHFGFNENTSGSNVFQKRPVHLTLREIHDGAIREFEGLVELLDSEGVHIIIVDDTEAPHTPDAIFPNNWFSTHSSGAIVLYPMEGKNRRGERREDIIGLLRKKHGFDKVIDLTSFEQEGKYLEGTGSMVFDRRNFTVFACLSSRTNEPVLMEFARRLAPLEVISFGASVKTNEETGFDLFHPIYHTNVMMAIGETKAVLCAEAIMNDAQRGKVISTLWRTGFEVVEITVAQLRRFAGNMLQLRTTRKDLLWVMSTQAFDSLTARQKRQLAADGSRIVHSKLDTIELVGGGSARCMMAEIFQPEKE